MAFGAANLARQVVIMAAKSEVPQVVRVASWVGTALVVIIAINSAAVVLRRRGDGAQLGTRGNARPDVAATPS